MPRHPLCGATAIAGLGITPQGKVYGNTALGFAVDAVRFALDDAGLERTDLDGLLLNPGLSWNDLGMGSFQLQQAMGLRDLRLSATMGLGGATASAMIQHAAQAVAAGVCTTVACVFSDAPLKPPSPERERSSSAQARSSCCRAASMRSPDKTPLSDMTRAFPSNWIRRCSSE